MEPGVPEPPEKVRSQSLFPGANLGSKRPFFRPAGRPFWEPFHTEIRGESPAYSAASASIDFGFAADIMKSLMRGTISERKREPLNTP